MHIFSLLGLFIVNLILGIASLLKNPAVPGYVVILFLIALAYCCFKYKQLLKRRKEALINASEAVKQSSSQAVNFPEAKNKEEQALSHAWYIYKDTLHTYNEDGQEITRTTLRPQQFFNSEELHFNSGGWKIVPSIFVSVGLFLTFLGLIAALHEMTNSLDTSGTAAIQGLLGVASAKFIMSLTGLFCSIIFTILQRRGMSAIEKLLFTLNELLEKKYIYISLEEIAQKQLGISDQTHTDLKNFLAEMTAELMRPLEALPRAMQDFPATMSEAVHSAISPVMEQLSRQGNEGVGAMVEDLSKRFSEDVGIALKEASHGISTAGEQIKSLAERMDQSSRKMSEGIEQAVNRLGNVAEEHAEITRQRLNQSAGEITQITQEMAAKTQEKLLNPLEDIAIKLHHISQNAANTSEYFLRITENINDCSNAADSASQNFRDSSDSLVEATSPIRSMIERIETTTRSLKESTDNQLASIKEATKANTQTAKTALESAAIMLGGQQKEIQATLKSLEDVIESLTSQGQRLLDIDHRLGNAFETYQNQVQLSVDTLSTHVRTMQDKLSPALDTMREVVEQAESFMPHQQRGN